MKSTTDSPKEGEQTALAIPQQKGIEFADRFKTYVTPTKDDFYKVKKRGGGYKEEPNARVLQSWANRNSISTSISHVEIGDKFTQAIVHGWVGDKSNPIMETEECVTIVYEFYEQEWLVNNLGKKSSFEPGVNKVVPSSPKYAEELFKYMNRKRMFADREAVTKAQSRIYRKLLGAEWREEAEQDAEAEEVATVQESIKAQAANGPQSSDKQQGFIAKLMSEMDAETAENIVKAYLKENVKKDRLDDLTVGEASDLIGILKGGEE